MPNRVRRRFLKGANPHQRPGMLQISLLTIPGGDHHETQVQELAGSIAAHFPADLTLFHGGRKVTISEAPSVAGGFQDTTRNRWLTPITVRFNVFA